MADLESVLAPLASPEWEHWAFGSEADPVGLAYVRRCGTYADVVLLHSDTVAITYRAPLLAGEEYSPLWPDSVMWFFFGDARTPIIELLKLPAHDLASRYTRVVDARVPESWVKAGIHLVRPATEPDESDAAQKRMSETGAAVADAAAKLRGAVDAGTAPPKATAQLARLLEGIAAEMGVGDSSRSRLKQCVRACHTG